MLLVICCGALFIVVGLSLHRTYGILAIAVWAVVVAAIGALTLGSVAADALDLPRDWGSWVVLFFLSPALVASGSWLHRLALRPARSFGRDLPTALAAFGVGLWVGFVTVMIILGLLIPRVY
jgi:hypothetical protein